MLSKIWRGIMGVLRRLVMVLGVVALIVIGLTWWGVAKVLDTKDQTDISSQDTNGPAILYWAMDQSIGEVEGRPSLSAPLKTNTLTNRRVSEKILQAVGDDKIHALLVSYRGASVSPTQLEEWGPAVQAFRKAGKKTVFYAADMTATGSMTPYAFATYFDHIVMMPSAALMLSGLKAEMPFARTALEKLGVTPQFVQRKEYKTAYENVTHTGLSAPNRAMLTSILTDVYNRMTTQMAANRNLSQAQLTAAIDRAVLTAAEAKAANLINDVQYGDDVVASLRTGLGKSPTKSVGMVTLADYNEPPASSPFTLHQQNEYADSKAKLAVITVSGAILLTTDGGQGMVDATKTADAILKAAKDDSVKGIMLRINSPGGSPAGSEVIRNAVVKAKAAGKPVYVSMGEAAASGGYWIAVDADKIYALPSTMTGSIGVIGGKFVLDGLWDKLGVSWDTIPVGGENAGLWSMNTPFTPGQLAAYERMMDATYSDFIARVANGRKMKPEAVENVAKGRVWTGTQAKAVGLVDALAPYVIAESDLIKAMNLSREDVTILAWPKPPTPLESFLEAFGMEMDNKGPEAILPPALATDLRALRVLDAALKDSGLRGAVISPSVMAINQ
ncbi:MAG: signal peptide peptidase SppA [Pseudomonadota bacterium]